MHKDGERYSTKISFIGVYKKRQNAANICIAHFSICFYLAPWFLCSRVKWLPYSASDTLFVWCVASAFLISSQHFFCRISAAFRITCNIMHMHYTNKWANCGDKTSGRKRRNEAIRSKWSIPSVVALHTVVK